MFLYDRIKQDVTEEPPIVKKLLLKLTLEYCIFPNVKIHITESELYLVELGNNFSQFLKIDWKVTNFYFLYNLV